MSYAVRLFTVNAAALRRELLARVDRGGLTAADVVLDADDDAAGLRAGDVVAAVAAAVRGGALDAPVGAAAACSTVTTLARLAGAAGTPHYTEMWAYYGRFLARIRGVSPGLGLLGAALSRGLFGRRAEGWPGAGALRPDEAALLAAAMDRAWDALLDAAAAGGDGDWPPRVRTALERAAREGLHTVHTWG